MRTVILIIGFAWGISLSELNAGTVITLTDTPAADGKLTLNPAAIHVEGSSASDINLPDILAANFSDVPFHLDYFRPKGDALNHLPDNWKGQDIEANDPPGSFTYAGGTVTIAAAGADMQAQPLDKLYFLGQPWTGDGQWVVHVQQMDADTGLMLRDSLDHGAAMFAMAPGQFHYRDTTGTGVGWGGDFPADVPLWLRLTRSGQTIDGAVSQDGKTWDTIGQYGTKISGNAWIGLYENSRNPKTTAKAVLDHIYFAPRPAQPETLPPGVLLKSGSFLAGSFNWLNPNAANFNHNGKNVTMTAAQISSVIWHQTTLHDIAGAGTQVGLIMKNGDFLQSDLQNIQGGLIEMTSIVLGPVQYYSDSVRACVLNQLKRQPSDYEIRLKDGSVLRANGVSVTDGKFTIGEVSGVAVEVAPDEIAQFRAGPSHVQNLIELPWKAEPPAPGAKAPPEEAPPIQSWTGPNQEQILAVPAETMVTFPLNDKFHNLAVQVALSPDSPPNALAAVHILSDGKEIGIPITCKAGDQPKFIEVALSEPKTVGFVADSSVPGTSVLFIDPVAIRSAPATPPSP